MGGKVMTRRRKIALLGACGAHLGLVLRLRAASILRARRRGVRPSLGGDHPLRVTSRPTSPREPVGDLRRDRGRRGGRARTTTEVLETGISRGRRLPRVRLLTTSLFDVDDEQAAARCIASPGRRQDVRLAGTRPRSG